MPTCFGLVLAHFVLKRNLQGKCINILIGSIKTGYSLNLTIPDYIFSLFWFLMNSCSGLYL